MTKITKTWTRAKRIPFPYRNVEEMVSGTTTIQGRKRWILKMLFTPFNGEYGYWFGLDVLLSVTTPQSTQIQRAEQKRKT